LTSTPGKSPTGKPPTPKTSRRLSTAAMTTTDTPAQHRATPNRRSDEISQIQEARTRPPARTGAGIHQRTGEPRARLHHANDLPPAHGRDGGLGRPGVDVPAMA